MKLRDVNEDSFYGRVYAIVETIPRGTVMSYGQIARMLGEARKAQQVGWAMGHCPDELPWHRVVKKDGTVAGGAHAELRRKLLEEEGVPFTDDGRVDMERACWL